MRIFFLFLLILNILFAAWQYFSPKQINTAIPPMSDKLERLVMLKEVTPVEPESEQPELTDVDKVVIDEDTLTTKTCYTLGPYTDKELVTKVESQLANNVIDFSVREREEQEVHRYWVYLPPYDSRQSARNASKKLAQKNVKDYYIIQKGDKKNSISLGHFKEKSYADARIKKITRLGYSPETEVIYRSYSLFWLDYALVDDDRDKLENGIQEFLVDGVTLLDRECE